jgi:predicted regulator of Ras-like GTPase activity (Roadblock/LC7/MglB family)
MHLFAEELRMIVTGNLKDFSLTDIIKMSCIDIQTCQIVIKTRSGEGMIYFSNGMPVHAQLGNSMGEDAVYQLLDETENFGGVFRVEPDIVLPKRTINKTWDTITEVKAGRSGEPEPEEVTSNSKKIDSGLYLGHREAITKVLQNFQAQASSKRSTPAPAIVTGQENFHPKPTEKPANVAATNHSAEPKVNTRAQDGSGLGNTLSQILYSLLVREQGIIEGVALVSTEGFIIASALPEGLEDEHVAAISAVIVSLGERITRELQRGTMEQVLVRGRNGYVFLTQAGPDALLTVITNPNAKLGMIFLDTKRTVKELEPLI